VLKETMTELALATQWARCASARGRGISRRRCHRRCDACGCVIMSFVSIR